jgi:MEMO1 family protein
MTAVHQSPYAGAWYPAGEGELRSLIEAAFERARARTGEYLLPDPIAFVTPHAGLMYSGTVACSVYRHLQARRPQRIILLGFSHRGGPAGVAIPEIAAYTTPLGETQLDHEAIRFLLAHTQFRPADEDQICDHSVEIQLPLLQYAAPAAKLVPLYVGSMPASEYHAAARALAQLADAGTIFLASSDLTHFGRAFGYEPFPADGRAAEKLAELDGSVMDDAGSLDAELFLEGLRHSGATVCGRAPIALLLRTLKLLASEEIFQETLDYQPSGELTGDFQHSVSYGALGYFPASSFRLKPRESAELLAVTRIALAKYLLGEPASTPNAPPELQRRAGVFVTLRENGNLRGCVGMPGGETPLADAVSRLVVSAATEDSRFAPVMPGFAGDLEVEISLLSPMKRVRNRDSYRLHEHGALLESGAVRSLLLPQVSAGRSWTALQFWEALAHKAKLPATVYGEPRTRLYLFRAQVIS